jgi:hypothetical protein
MTKKQQIDALTKKIEELNEKLWQMKLERRKLQGKVKIIGFENTKL